MELETVKNKEESMGEDKGKGEKHDSMAQSGQKKLG